VWRLGGGSLGGGIGGRVVKGILGGREGGSCGDLGIATAKSEGGRSSWGVFGRCGSWKEERDAVRLDFGARLTNTRQMALKRTHRTNKRRNSKPDHPSRRDDRRDGPQN
jgi:hypothetical protein